MEKSAKTFGTFFYTQFVKAGILSADFCSEEAAFFGSEVVATLQKYLDASSETVEETLSDVILKLLNGRIVLTPVRLPQAKRFITTTAIRCCQDVMRRNQRTSQRFPLIEAEETATTQDIDLVEAKMAITDLATHLNETVDERSSDWMATILREDYKADLACKWGITAPGVRKFEERHLGKFQVAANTFLV